VPCSLVDKYQCLGGTLYTFTKQHGNAFQKNLGIRTAVLCFVSLPAVALDCVRF
jgi:hypothetical protein